jgi:hypothetical protein
MFKNRTLFSNFHIKIIYWWILMFLLLTRMLKKSYDWALFEIFFINSLIIFNPQSKNDFTINNFFNIIKWTFYELFIWWNIVLFFV